MTDEEKIEQEAKRVSWEPDDFKEAVRWRDENPSPKVLALMSEHDELKAKSLVLVESLRKEARFLTLRGMLPIPEHIQQALAPWDCPIKGLKK